MAPKKNRFKTKTGSKKEGKSPDKKKGTFSKLRKGPAKYIRALKDERTQKVFGSFLLLLSAYLLISFISFLFTWKADQDKVASPAWSDFLFNPEIQVENWLGKLGALTSHIFIHNWFGVGSFLFIFLFFIIGFRILFRIKLVPLSRALPYSIFIILWSSVTLGYLFKNELFFLGGAFGFHTNEWLVSLLGRIGTGFFLVFALATFIIIAFNPSLDPIVNLFRGKEKEEPEEEGSLYPTEEPEEDPGETVEPDKTNSQEEEDQEPELEEEATGTEQEELEDNFTEEKFTFGQQEEEAETEGTDEQEGQEEQEHFEGEVELDPSNEEKSEGSQEKSGGEESEEGFSVSVAEGDEEATEQDIKEKLKEFGEFDPKLELSDYQIPPLELMEDHGNGEVNVSKEELEANKDRIVNTLANYKIKISKIKATIGPTLTLYEIVPAAGIRISKIRNLQDDIALSLSALGIRIIAPIPGRGTVGIEVPNSQPAIVSMRSLIASEKFQNSGMELPMALGKTISNESYITDLTKMPHLLIAGATGQGKSVGLNAILTSFLYKKHPSQVKFVLVDPKKVELNLFNKLERHFLAKLPDEEEPIITDTNKVINTLRSLCKEMDDRYELLKDAQVRNLKEYNKKFIQRRLNPEKGHRYLPYIVLVIDEFADLIMTAGKDIEQPIARLAQLARAIGIHLIIATQRPSVKIITGMIKANFPARIAFKVTSSTDSRTILDSGGAEQLIGKGDMLISTGSDLVRVQCGFIDTDEVEKVAEHIGAQRGYPNPHLLPEVDDQEGEGGTLDDEERDALFEDAARLIVQHQQGSTSLIQRKLKLGYNRAGRIIDQLESAGIIGPFEGSKARKVLIPDEYALEQFLNQNEGSNENANNEEGQ